MTASLSAGWYKTATFSKNFENWFDWFDDLLKWFVDFVMLYVVYLYSSYTFNFYWLFFVAVSDDQVLFPRQCSCAGSFSAPATRRLRIATASDAHRRLFWRLTLEHCLDFRVIGQTDSVFCETCREHQAFLLFRQLELEQAYAEQEAADLLDEARRHLEEDRSHPWDSDSS